MQTLRRYLFRQLLGATALVLLVFLGLLFFLDALNQLSDNGHGFAHALMLVALQLPARAYQVLPIAVLTGAVYVLAGLAASSEFTVMRMAGLNPRVALAQLVGFGLLSAAVVFALGDFVAPAAQRLQATLQAKAAGGSLGSAPEAGLWVRNREGANDDQMINIGAISAGGTLRDVRIYVLDDAAHLLRTVHAASATYLDGGEWELRDVESVQLPTGAQGDIQRTQLAQLRWHTAVSPAVLDALVLSPDDMSVFDLWRYIRHLRANGQAVQRAQLELWRKLLYPLSGVIMMMLALPFAYLHARSGQLSWKVFAGIMLGVSFILMNTLASRLGLVASWPVWLAAALPYLLYGGAALGFFVWRVQRH
ncbi:MAG: LPS export ABC transporter permease LptG [Betaproteobacteria bacterium]|nr:LPS export ABC transporter permease LptG [Betaproteobacteria bacterium]